MTLTTLFLVALCLPSIVIASLYPPAKVNFPTQESLLEAAFDAIKYLHAQIDDHSGSVDLPENNGLMKEELSDVRKSDASCFFWIHYQTLLPSQRLLHFIPTNPLPSVLRKI